MKDALATLSILLLGLGFLIPARGFAGDKKSDKVKCSNNLKMIGMAAIQYCDDKRFLPHLGKFKDLDNKGDTTPAGNDVPPRCLRSLVFLNYLDSPEAFVCSASGDVAKELTNEAKDDIRKFGWGGTTPAETNATPIVVADKNDKDADALKDLSYGYTLRGLNANSQAESYLAGDRARKCGPRSKQKIGGNHEKGWNIVYVDCHVTWIKADDDEAKLLSSTSAEDKGKCLVVWDEANCGDEVKKDERKKGEKMVVCKLCGEMRPSDSEVCPHCGCK